MYTIHLRHLEFYGYHGLHEEESVIGNKFEVDVDIHFESALPISDISHTINYVSVFNVIKAEMNKTQKLIETLCERICNQIHSLHNGINSIEITIYKSNAPIPSFSGRVGVSLKKNFLL